MIKGLKEKNDGSLMYSRFQVKNIPCEKFPEMASIEKAPKKFSEMIGKKYITMQKLILAVDERRLTDSIAGSKYSALKELTAVGLRDMNEI